MYEDELQKQVKKENELTEEQLAAVSAGISLENLKCPYCGSSNIVPFYSPTKGRAYLCGNCYRPIEIKIAD